MKLRKRQTEIFNMSFLDIISCGFGAIVLMILISKSGESTTPSTVNTGAALKRTFAMEEQLKQLSLLQEKLKLKLAENQGSNQDAELSIARMTRELESKQRFSASLEQENTGLSKTQKTLKSITLNANTATKQDSEVGGIPVDSDYVIFVIDTSGSMQQIWSQVRITLENILDIHPQINGFQILNDNGHHMVADFHGRWINDNATNRRKAIQSIQKPTRMSNSSPIEGIEVALKTYAKEAGKKISIYVFGDDYTGNSYDRDIESITLLNTHRLTGRHKTKIHGVGFFYSGKENKFSTLMREMTHRNKGAFLALSKK